jgi:hypothetical protein
MEMPYIQKLIEIAVTNGVGYRDNSSTHISIGEDTELDLQIHLGELEVKILPFLPFLQKQVAALKNIVGQVYSIDRYERLASMVKTPEDISLLLTAYDAGERTANCRVSEHKRILRSSKVPPSVENLLLERRSEMLLRLNQQNLSE